MLWFLLACMPSPVPPAAPADGTATAAATAPDAPSVAPVPIPTRSPPWPLVAPGEQDPVLRQLVDAARSDATAYERLGVLCDDYPRRLAGTEALEGAVQWTAGLFVEDGHEGVATEEVMVPRWVRGPASLRMLAPQEQELAVLSLGGSVGTGGPIEAPVVVVGSFDELGPEVSGKIVLYNVPMASDPPTIRHYGSTVQYRTKGAVEAARHGAVGVLVRSVATRSLYTPHTGAMGYEEGVPPIPAAAVTVEDAEWLARLQARGQQVRVSWQMHNEEAPEALSHNVLAEVRGSERPEEIVVIGGHLDAWDVGCGAHDDGAGIIESIEALRQIRALGVAPRRTIRAVLFTNEENGLRGGKAYAEAHATDTHVALLESDLGGGWPLGFGMSGSSEQLAWVQRTLAPLGLPVTVPGGGADIGPTHRATGVPAIGLRPDDTHYFDVHHTEADTLDKVDPASLQEAVAAFAGAAWLLANAEDPPAPVVPGTD